MVLSRMWSNSFVADHTTPLMWRGVRRGRSSDKSPTADLFAQPKVGSQIDVTRDVLPVRTLVRQKHQILGGPMSSSRPRGPWSADRIQTAGAASTLVVL